MDSSTCKCKLCFKCFPNGRSLGGHMRSHMMNLQAPINQEFSNESASSESYQENFENDILMSYVLKENPKKSFRLVDPEFLDAGCSVFLHNRESESETSKNLTTRRSSKRTRKHSALVFENQQLHDGDVVIENVNKKVDKLESAGSIFNETTEEEVAYSLIMLSRDKLKEKDVQFIYENQEVETEESEEQKMCSKRSRSRGKYKCETCNKRFRSYQALGGHRASHKKIKTSALTTPELEKVKDAEGTTVSEKKIHGCPFCSRIFTSGQALGGHKRSHFTNGGCGVIAPATSLATPAGTAKFGQHFLDLNLPAPIEDDDVDAEFINPIKQ